jgi:hypothetical protein
MKIMVVRSQIERAVEEIDDALSLPSIAMASKSRQLMERQKAALLEIEARLKRLEGKSNG